MFKSSIRDRDDFATGGKLSPGIENQPESFGPRAGGLLKVAGDTLALCICIDPTKAKGKMPEQFSAPAGSGHILFEFRREK